MMNFSGDGEGKIIAVYEFVTWVMLLEYCITVQFLQECSYMILCA